MTSAKKKGYFHCAQCGSFSEQTIDYRGVRECPSCGQCMTGEALQDKTIARDVDVRSDLNRVILPVDPEGHGERHQEEVGMLADEINRDKVGKIKRTVPVWELQEKSRSRLLLLFIVVVTASCLALIIYTNKDLFLVEPPVVESAVKRKEAAQNDAENRLLSQSLPNCMLVMKSFLEARDATTRSQFVFHGHDLLEIMEEYYTAHPRSSRGITNVRSIHASILDIDHRLAIGTICEDDSGDRFEAVFIEDNGNWKIDWKSFVRYNPVEWHLFDSANNGDEGVFRLYMRLLEVGDDIAGDDLLVVFYQPDIFRSEPFKAKASESVRVPADSDQGMAIKALVRDRAARGGCDKFGAKLSDFDSEKMHRVRIHVRLHKEASGRHRVELLAIIADHWYGEEIASPDTKADS